MNEENALTVPVHSIGDDQLLAVAEAAERRVDAVNRIKNLSLRVTNHQDWTNQGGKPYLQVSGSEKVARLFGISWRLDEPTREDHNDGHFSYTFKGYFSMGSAEIEVVGTRSSSDPFFGGSKDNPKPPSEIDRNDVKKGAMTNCIGNGISRLLGIRNLTWDELKAAGISQEKTGTVNYKSSDPNQAPVLPNYGGHKGKLVTDPTVSLDALHYYLDGCIKSIADPKWEKAKPKNEALRDALKAEIVKREGAAQEKPAEQSKDNEPPASDKLAAFLMLLDSADSKDMLQDLWNTISKEIKTELPEADQKKVSTHFLGRKKEFEK